MPRKKRIWYPGAEYHVMNRGNRRGDLFRDDEDYEKYLEFLLGSKKKCPFILAGYCLMTNHVHLQVKTTNIPLWRIMQHIHFKYSRYFNDKYNLIGHLFQGRYTAQLIETERYCLQTSRYIHLNPVKAKMVTSPILYPWSSYKDLLNQSSQDGVVDRDYILGFFKHNPEARYQDFVENEDLQHKESDQAIAKEMKELE